MQHLTNNQARVLEYIIKFIEVESYSPTVTEMITDFKYKSRNAMRQPLVELERKGYILRQPPGAPRNIMVLFDSEQRPVTYHLWRGVVTEIGPVNQFKIELTESAKHVERLETKIENLKSKIRLLQRLADMINNELES